MGHTNKCFILQSCTFLLCVHFIHILYKCFATYKWEWAKFSYSKVVLLYFLYVSYSILCGVGCGGPKQMVKRMNIMVHNLVGAVEWLDNGYYANQHSLNAFFCQQPPPSSC